MSTRINKADTSELFPEKVHISMESIQKWFRPETTEKEVQDTIVAALKLYFETQK